MPRSKSPYKAALQLVAALLWASAGVEVVSAQDPSPGLELEVKAEFIERFTYYVEWPSRAFPSDTGSFILCVEGEGPIQSRLQAVLAENRIKDRRVALRALGSGDSAKGCHILYIAPSESPRVDQIVRRTGGAPVLTIGDSPGFTKAGVIINMFLEGSHVRFAINAKAAKANGLAVSAKLMAMARKDGR